MQQKAITFLIASFISLNSFGQTIPNFVHNDVNGNPHDLYSILDNGGAVVLHFFASWSSPTQVIEPYMTNLYNQNVHVWAIDIESSDTPAAILNFMASYGGNYPHFQYFDRDIYNYIFGDTIGYSLPYFAVISGCNRDILYDKPGWLPSTMDSINDALTLASQFYSSICDANVEGFVYEDLDLDCTLDPGDNPLSGWKLKLTPGPRYAVTDTAGHYSMRLDSGTYTIQEIIPHSVLWDGLCPAIPAFYTFTVDSGDNVNLNFANEVDNYCPILSVEIGATRFRRGRPAVFNVRYCNDGNAAADSVFVEVVLDNLLTYISSSIPVMSSFGNTYNFEIDSLRAGDCGSFKITAMVNTVATNGKTICIPASVFPIDYCAPISQDWDQSSVKIDRACIGDSLVCFTIHNTGDPGAGDMQGNTELRVYEDNVLVGTEQIRINGGDSIIRCYPANGKTIRLEVDQRPHHPGNSQPNVFLEGCGTDSTGGTSLGQILPIQLDDGDDFVSIYCAEIRGSWDPNEKLVQPSGLTESHFIRSNTRLKYHLGFQNTGNDTAFKVVLKDTLSDHVDIESVQSGSSSHDYTFNILGSNILEWTFNDILLVDSFTNEPESHGYVEFTVEQRPNNPEGTLIENEVSIYFDFNPPVVTDMVFNIVSDSIYNIPPPAGVGPAYFYDAFVKVYPNPFKHQLVFEVYNNNADQFTTYQLEMFDLLGRSVLPTEEFVGSRFVLWDHSLQQGFYFYRLQQDGAEVSSGRVVLIR